MTTLGPPKFPALGRVLEVLADRPPLKEAVERMALRELVPEWWTDPGLSPLWSDPTVRLSTVPRNFDHLVTAAGLGLPTLLHLHEMVRGVWRSPRILLSFRSAESLRKHHLRAAAGSFGPRSRLRSPTREQVFSREEAAAPDPERIPWDEARVPVEPALKRAWPLLRGIAAVGVDFLDEWCVGPLREESTRVVLGIPFPIPGSAE